MDVQTIEEKITAIKSKRDYLLSLLEQPSLGTLRIDVNQALEEMDELVDEYERTFNKSDNNWSDIWIKTLILEITSVVTPKIHTADAVIESTHTTFTDPEIIYSID